MVTSILVGTDSGLHEVGEADAVQLDGHAVSALAVENERVWAVVGDQSVVSRRNGHWEEITHLDRLLARCVLPLQDRVLVGTSEARLLDGSDPVDSFDRIDTRDRWFTPWGAPPDTRSLARDAAGGWWVNVHVGGVWHSADGGSSWTETVEVDADVHEVRCDPVSGAVAVAAAVGFGLSHDRGRSWEWITEGLHAHYCRAVAFAGSWVLVSASTGPGNTTAAVYRRPLAGGAFERCRSGLPEWFEHNVDTGCLAADGSTAVIGTQAGQVYLSQDSGLSWTRLAENLPPVRAVVIAPR